MSGCSPCETPTEIDIQWNTGTTGQWSRPLNWSAPLFPPTYPHNTACWSFHTRIAGPDSTVILNTSPTITSLDIGLGGALILDGGPNGAPDVRSLQVDGPLENLGTIRSAGSRVLLLDADSVTMGLGDDPDGRIEAETAAPAGRVQSSTVAIRRAVIRGGTLLTSGASSEIRLQDGATIVDVRIERTRGANGVRQALSAGVAVDSVKVPSGHLAGMSGTIRNDGVITVDGSASAASLVVRDGMTVLDTTPCDPSCPPRDNPACDPGCLILIDDARFSADGLTHAAEHRMLGAGSISGKLDNNGIIEATEDGRQLIVTGSITQMCTGRLGATQGELLLQGAQVSGDGGLRVVGGGAVSLDDKARVSVSTCTWSCPERRPWNGYSARLLGSSELSINGTTTVSGVVQVTEASTVVTQQLDVCCTPPAVDAQMPECPALTAVTDLADPANPACTNPAAIEVDATSELVVDRLSVGFGSSLDIAGTVRLCESFAFNNRVATEVMWDTGAHIVIAETLPDGTTCAANGSVTIEAGGEDQGGDAPDTADNFQLGAVTVDAGVTLRVVSDYPNATGAAAGEALYIDTLRIMPGASVECPDIPVYVRDLDGDPGAACVVQTWTP